MADAPDVLNRLEERAAAAIKRITESQGGACWLIWSNYHWGPNGGGYSDVAGAGRYTLSEALSWAEQRSVDPNDPRSNPPELVVPAPEFIARAERLQKGEV